MQEGSGERVGPWGWPEERASWTWPGHEGAGLSVNVYAKDCCDAVRLHLNGVVVGGDAPISRDTQYTATLTARYKPGNLTVVGIKNGTVVRGAAKTLLTAGAVAKLALVLDRPAIAHNRNDLAYATVSAHDAVGTLVPDADLDVAFTVVSGAVPAPVELAAVGSGSPTDLSTLVNGTRRKLWRGRALAILRPTAGSLCHGGSSTSTLTVRAKLQNGTVLEASAAIVTKAAA